MENRLYTGLYFFGVSIINLYPIYIAITMVSIVNRSGHDVDGWLNIIWFSIKLAVIAAILLTPVYLLGWQFGAKWFNFFQTNVYLILVGVATLSLIVWYVYTAVQLY